MKVEKKFLAFILEECLEDDIDFDLLSSLSSGFVGADIEMVCKDAALNSVQKLLGATDISYDEVDQIKINQDNFLSALSTIQPLQ